MDRHLLPQKNLVHPQEDPSRIPTLISIGTPTLPNSLLQGDPRCPRRMNEESPTIYTLILFCYVFSKNYVYRYLLLIKNEYNLEV